ncbi:nucleoid occlusion factor SlmA [Halomonas garicola]|uniref:nucleoid occlusion factor SlmA n=1 Tax=Halomonas garicola TaxID=1690008 RepID=UPI00289C84C9|nr:nucleoid occlusion factor SlmA [Halomonas garicola]
MSGKPKPNRHEQILQALAQMLEDDRGKRITIAALAQQVGVSEAALYRHFPSKARMYEGLIDFIEQSLFTRVTRITAEVPDAEGRCGAVVSLLLGFAEKNPGLARVMGGDALTGETARLRLRIHQLFERLELALKQTLREAELNEGRRPGIPAAAAANLLMAHAEGRISQYVRSDFKHLPTAYWDDQWALLSARLMQPAARSA